MTKAGASVGLLLATPMQATQQYQNFEEVATQTKETTTRIKRRP